MRQLEGNGGGLSPAGVVLYNDDDDWKITDDEYKLLCMLTRWTRFWCYHRNIVIYHFNIYIIGIAGLCGGTILWHHSVDG